MVDEEALAGHLSPAQRKRTGAFFTPRALVDRALDALAPHLPSGGPQVVVDPACGAGAFLVAAAERWPGALLAGGELDQASARQCQARLPRARIVEGDVLTTSALDEVLGEARGFEAWVGNPPYNGTSPLLRDKEAWRRACEWLPLELPRGTSLREDYVFFLLRASLRLERRPGALAFITSASLLDAFNYAPVREALLGRLSLREVIDLGPGAFAGTTVHTAITVWTSAAGGHEPRGATDDGARARPRHLESAPPLLTRRAEAAVKAFAAMEGHPETSAPPLQGRTPHPVRFGGVHFTPGPPSWSFRPVEARAAGLDVEWREGGATVTALVPVSFPGLKTRFDELLVDDDEEVLFERVRAFLSCAPGALEGFARDFGLEARHLVKLAALKASSVGLEASRASVRAFLRYRGPLPMLAPGFCYLERALIPRGDHRLRGAYDPHLEPVKLVFNQHELPLAAHVLDAPGCVTAYRHSRFAPLHVPVTLLDAARGTRPPADGPMVPNLSPIGLAWARRLGSPRAVFEHIARHVMSEAFQRGWAPAHGRLGVPLIAPPG